MRGGGASIGGSLDAVFPPEFLGQIEAKVRGPGPWQYVRHVLVDAKEHPDWSRRQRLKLEKVLALADRHGELGADTVARLRSPDEEPFWGRLSEFKVAEFLESRGLRISFRPSTRGTREGEFILHLPKRDVFVEVKTMFPQLADRRANRHLDALRMAARAVAIPAFVSLWIQKDTETEFRIGPFKKFLRERIPELMKSGREFAAAEYRDDRTGLRVLVTFMSLHNGRHLIVGSVTDRLAPDHEVIRRTLKRAHPQLPSDCPVIVALCSQLGHPPSPMSFQDALYGRVGVLLDRSGGEPAEIQTVRERDGFLCPHKNTRLSAVIFLDEFRTQRPPDSHMDIYHHPTPAFPLTPRELLIISDRQWHAQEAVIRGDPGLVVSHPFGEPHD